MTAWTWIVAGLLAMPALVKTVQAVTPHRRQPARLHSAAPDWPTVDPDPAPMPPPAAGTSPDPAAGGAPHRTTYDLRKYMPTPETLR